MTIGGQYFNTPTAIILKDSSNKDKEFLLDASVRINTSLTAKATSYPVDGGGFISDHVQPEPLRLQLTGVISQSPSSILLSLANSVAGYTLSQVSSLKGLSSTFATAAVASGIAALASGLGGANPDDPADYVRLLTQRNEFDQDYPKRAMQGLIELFKAGKPFNIRTYFSDTIYTNMVATSITFPQDATVGNSLRFSMSCVKINIVNSDTDKTLGVSELKATDPAGSSQAPVKDKGALDGKSQNISAADNSALYSLRPN